jgi:hypothetical protein
LFQRVTNSDQHSWACSLEDAFSIQLEIAHGVKHMTRFKNNLKKMRKLQATKRKHEEDCVICRIMGVGKEKVIL